MVPAPATSTVLRASVCWFSSTAEIEPTIVTSSPSRIQVMPSEMTTSQCHRLQGRRSILVGMFVLTGFTSGPTLLLIVFIAPRLLYSSLCCSDYAHVFAHVSE